MLSEETIEKLTERIVLRVQKGNEYILKNIGENIKKIGTVIPSQAQQLAMIMKYGGSYDAILNKLAQITELNVKDIEKIFEEVAKDNYVFAKQFYEYRGIDFIPYEENVELQNQVKAFARMTINNYINLSNTSAIGFTVKDIDGKLKFKGLQETYFNAIDEAVINISQGKESFQSQMYRTLQEIGNGVKTINYESGYSRRLDSAVRMNIQGGLRDLQMNLQQQFGQEFGADGVEISVHMNPAPDHADIQGRQFTLEQFNNMQNVIDFENTDGKKYSAIERAIGMWNCYHYIFSIVVGVNKPEYTDKQLKEISQKNKEGFELDGKHYTNYEGTQMQRGIETAIRKQKDMNILAKASGNEELLLKSQSKIDKLMNKYLELSKISKLPTKMERLNVEGYRRIKN